MQLDHVLYGGPDLERLSQSFAALTGVVPVAGGSHPGLGTHNALAAIGSTGYFELLACDPAQNGGVMGDMVRAMRPPRLFAYMFAVRDIASFAPVYERHGIKAALSDGRRIRPDGVELKWQLLIPAFDHPFGHLLPKLIEWHSAAHPAQSAPAGCSLHRFELGLPEPAPLAALMQDLGAQAIADVVRADHPSMRLILDTPKGKVNFASIPQGETI